jgi:hypothetical protein
MKTKLYGDTTPLYEDIKQALSNALQAFVIVRPYPSAKLVDLFGEFSALRPGRYSLRDIAPGTRPRGDCKEWGTKSFHILTKRNISPCCPDS